MALKTNESAVTTDDAAATKTNPQTEEGGGEEITDDVQSGPAVLADSDIDGDEDGLWGEEVFYEEPASGSIFPVLTYLNGDPKGVKGTIAHSGGFFAGLDQGIQVKGAVPFTLQTGENREVEGYGIQNLVIQPVRVRRAWQVVNEDSSLSTLFAQAEYDDAIEAGSPRGKGHLLGLVQTEGGELEPVIVNFGGINAGKVFGQDGAIKTFHSKVVMPARRASRKAGRKMDFPMCAFKLTIGPTTKDGKPVFVQVGKKGKTSQIVHPAWIDALMGAPTRRDLTQRMVSKAAFQVGQQLANDTEDWYDAWGPEQLAAQRARLNRAAGTTSAPKANAATDKAGSEPSEESPGF